MTHYQIVVNKLARIATKDRFAWRYVFAIIVISILLKKKKNDRRETIWPCLGKDVASCT